MHLSVPAAALTLQVHGPLDPTVAALLVRELDGLGATLQPWGRFTRPVRLQTTALQADLRAAASCATELHLHGVATLDGLLLLAPTAWLTPPAAHELTRLVLHELAHVLLFQRCAPAGATAAAYLPTWFREGMATVVTDGPPHPGLRRRLAAHPDLDALPGASDAVMTADPEACYDAAALLFQAWSDRFGARGLATLCRAMRSGHAFAAAHAQATGLTEAAWLAGWLTSVRSEAASD